MRPVRKVVEDATLLETLKAAAQLVGHELPARVRDMHSDDYAGVAEPVQP